MSNTSIENAMDDKSGPIETAFAHDEEDSYEMNAPVAKKWQGTVADRQDMSALGRVQELRVRYSTDDPSACCIAC